MSTLFSPRVVRGFLKRVHDTGDGGTAAEVGATFEAITRRWSEVGLRPGDLVILALPNGLGLLNQFFGALGAGLVPALISPSTPTARIREVTEQMGARAVVANRAAVGPLGAVGLDAVGGAVAALLPATAEPPTAPGEVVLLTSGTSGFSSGCVFALESLFLNAARHAESIGQGASDIVLVNLPLHFSFALVAQALATLVTGGRLVVSGPPFHVPTYRKDLEEHGVTISSITPVLVRTVLDQGVSFPETLRVLTVGGDALAPEHVARLLRARPGRKLYLTYGLTQAGPRVSTLAAHDALERRYASVGLPLDGTVVALKEIPDGSGDRQLLVRSQTIMKSRIGLVEGRPDGLRDSGWLATGDVFERDEDGYLFFRRRMSDYIVRGGEKVCLTSIRRLATLLPRVAGARTRIVPRPDGNSDFELMLTVVGDPGQPAPDYRGLLARSLRPSEMPRKLEIISADAGSTVSYK
jgi:acyl-CoA synthetase (AMP-forming)/AMP-acid ligase II